MFKFNIIERLKIIFNFGKNKKSQISRGGDGGKVFITTRKIIGDGKITADGGDGSIGGKGGEITVISKDNQFTGNISVKGGKSFSRIPEWYEKWWGILILGVIASTAVSLIFYFL